MEGGVNVKQIQNLFQLFLTLLGGGLGWFFGGFDGFWYALVVLVAVDYITGVLNAVLEKKLSSEIGFRGICKKLLIFLLVGVANILDQQIIGSGDALRTAVIFFYSANEGISILENAAKIGLPVPKKLKEMLAQIQSASTEMVNQKDSTKSSAE